MPARFGGDKFCIVLPGSDQEAARPALQRIAGVIYFTKFTIKDDGEPAQVNLQNRCATLPAGDSAESLIARARTEIAKG